VAQAMQKKREEKKKSKVLTDRKALANVRVIQRNLVYVVGLSMHICREEVSCATLLAAHISLGA
jgi:hypothetical protein